MTRNSRLVFISLLLAELVSGHAGTAHTGHAQTKTVVRTSSSSREAVISVGSDGTLSVDTGSLSQQDPPSGIRHHDPPALRPNHTSSHGRQSISQHAALLGVIPQAHLQLLASLGTLICDTLSLNADDHGNLAEQALTLEKENWDDKKKEYSIGVVVGYFCMHFALLILVFVIALCYKSRVTDNRKPYPHPVPSQWSLANGDFKYGLFGCMDDMNYCLTACFCPLCRDADTYAAVGVAGFWSVFIMSLVLNAIAVATCNVIGYYTKVHAVLDIASMGPWVGLILESCYFGSLRQRLRESLGGNGTQCYVDCLCYHFCTCCVIAQNARHVDLASEAHVAFCCTLSYPPDDSSIPIVVGEPVPVQGPPAPSNNTEPPATN